jgi:hypothetical protein
MFISVFVFLLLGFVQLGGGLIPVMSVAGLCYGILPSALYPLLAEEVPEEAFPQVGVVNYRKVLL